MKKKISLGMLLVFLLVLVGCGKNSSSKVDSSTSKDANEVVLYVTRHGKTMFNSVHRAQGWSDTPLTAPGVEVAEQLGRGFKKDNIEFVSAYSSDLGRARQTAHYALVNNNQEDLNVQESEKLREVCFGSYEGETDEVMWGETGKDLGYDSYDDFMSAVIGGESSIADMLTSLKKLDTSNMSEDWDGVGNRMREELTEIAKKTEEAGGGNVLVVAHGMSILAMISEMTDQKPAGGQLPNASVTKIVYKDGKFDVQEVGNLEYVEKGAA
ncbi:histidine phosphatase family protein [Streptococcaceae bacterium ESL0687]|nr:histidine phosphatase family protein [Streptococcaceae bacterium ESL0687]